MHQYTLGDLELEAVGAGTGIAQNSQHFAGEISLPELMDLCQQEGKTGRSVEQCGFRTGRWTGYLSTGFKVTVPLKLKSPAHDSLGFLHSDSERTETGIPQYHRD